MCEYRSVSGYNITVQSLVILQWTITKQIENEIWISILWVITTVNEWEYTAKYEEES